MKQKQKKQNQQQQKYFKIILFSILIIGALLLASCSSSKDESSTSDSSTLSTTESAETGASETESTVLEAKTAITVYKSPSCGCCGGYITELQQNEYDVTVIPTNDFASLKTQYHIPREVQSCHTAVLGNYFIEGHVPIEVLEKLIEEQPAIDGVALPGMPSGATGMGGMKQGTWTIYAITDGIATEYMRI